MARIFLSAGHGGQELGRVDRGIIAGGTTEAQEMILLRDLVASEVRSRNVEVLSVPDDLSAVQTVAWINVRTRPGDVALELHANAAANPAVRGATVYHIANNEERRADARLLLQALLRRVPQLADPQGDVKPDTATATGRLMFCRDVIPASLLMEVAYLTNPEDRFLLQNRRQDIAAGIADGLVAWVRNTALPPVPSPSPSPTPPTVTYPEIGININNRIYPEAGILVNGNSYIPVDLVDRLGIDLTQADLRRITYQGVVYVKAIDVRDYNISVSWDNPNRTVVLYSSLKICPGDIDRIMSHGNTTEVQMELFLRENNSAALNAFPNIATLYRQEGTIEGVNYDIAFCQMCLETNYLRFGGELQPSYNNFAGLGGVGGLARFPSARIGVMAHIQHLKAYASTEPLVQEKVDPRFDFVNRGIAPLVGMLSGRWAADLDYGAKIMALVRRLYELADLL